MQQGVTRAGSRKRTEDEDRTVRSLFARPRWQRTERGFFVAPADCSSESAGGPVLGRDRVFGRDLLQELRRLLRQAEAREHAELLAVRQAVSDPLADLEIEVELPR